MFEGEERVALQETVQATHKGNLKGFPASDRRNVWCDMKVSQFRDGPIAEEWVITDLAEQLLLARKQKS